MLREWQSAVAAADLADWITVAAYLFAAFTSNRASQIAWMRRKDSDKFFWQITAALLIFLGINELLDLQALLTSLGRAHAKAYGWYGEHRKVQYLFILALTFLAVLAGIATLLLTQQARISVRVALIGLGFIGVFVLMRAASFHHLDELLGKDAILFNWSFLLEFAGITVVAIASISYSRWPRQRQ